MSVNGIIEDSLYDSFRFILDDMNYQDVDIVFSHQNGMEPKNTYLMINLLSTNRVGRVFESTYLTEQEDMWYTNHYTTIMQLSFLGGKSKDVAFDFNDSIFSDRVYIESLQKRGLGVITKSDLRRQPQPRESEWVELQNLDLTMSFAVQTRRKMDWVEFITINGELHRIYPYVLGERTVDTGELRNVGDGEPRQNNNI